MTVTISDLMARWHVSRSTIERRCLDGTLSPMKIGGVIRFRLEEIEAAEEAARRLPLIRPTVGGFDVQC
ncbi:MAG: helix-turn-helix domain-containing protein [Planctomycetota bacterium]